MARLIRNKNYPIIISSDLDQLKDLEVFKRPYSGYFLLVDENTDRLCLPKLLEHNFLPQFTKIIIPAGEEFKNLEFCRFIFAELARAKADRNSLLINLGGGVVGDMGGFVAASYKRGIDYIHIPTTLLAMVDASIGGKTGVNLDVVKNLIGAYKNPEAVVSYTGFLDTLPEKELKSGFAEVLKHALINGKRQYWLVKRKPSLKKLDWEKIIHHSAKEKFKVVRKDFKEKGIRKILNLGHTFGHALESYFMQSELPLSHGEAIAEGLIFEGYLAHLKYGFPEYRLKELTTGVRKYFPRDTEVFIDQERIMELMLHDKKNKSGNISFSLLKEPGVYAIDTFCSREELKKAFDFWTSAS